MALMNKLISILQFPSKWPSLPLPEQMEQPIALPKRPRSGEHKNTSKTGDQTCKVFLFSIKFINEMRMNL